MSFPLAPSILKRFPFLVFFFGSAALLPAEDRALEGLQALYDFSETDGEIVHDRSGADQPVHLKITNPNAVRQTGDALEVRDRTIIQSGPEASRIIDAIRRSGEFTVEAWVRPAETGQDGPARIVTVSKNSSERNFTLGQDGDRFDVRFRTTKTSKNGMPSLSSDRKSLAPELTHIVYTRERGGQTSIFVNGKRREDQKVAGDPSNWDGSFRLALANELSGDRPWLGAYHLVAIYDRDLSPAEIERHFKAGAGASTEKLLARRKADENARLFESEVAPLLAEHCLECHDSVNREGKLDLSRKATALAEVIVPGQPERSELWDAVAHDDMPEDSPPLSPVQKATLRKWIEDGATWTLDVIDPADYLHDTRATQIWVQRLTVNEYIETVRAATGVDIEKEARELLPPDLRADGFSNTAYNLNIDLQHVEAYARLAAIIVGRMDAEAFVDRFSRNNSVEDKHMRELTGDMGKWLLRGPLSEQEVAQFRGIATSVAGAGGDFDEATAYIIEAMLQAPRFIYRIENQRGGHLSGHELASRLSYILWGAPPDEELFKAADSGKLNSPERIEAEVERMLDDPRAKTRSAQFLTEWLNINRVRQLQPNAEKFPNWTDQLARDMREETLAFFNHIIWEQNRPMSDLLNAQITFLTPALARHYGLEPKGDGLVAYDVSNIPGRGGILTHGSVLTVGGDEASMVARGLFVLHDLLRGVVKDPPPCVDTTPVPTQAGLTQRAIALERIADKNCGGCHAKFEPLAFGLEKFDGIGAFHEKDEHGNELRDDGEILFPGASRPVAYGSSAELMDLLAGSARVRETITWKLSQFALGRPLTAVEAPILDEINHTAWENDGTYPALVTAIVTSDLVRSSRRH